MLPVKPVIKSVTIKQANISIVWKHPYEIRVLQKCTKVDIDIKELREKTDRLSDDLEGKERRKRKLCNSGSDLAASLEKSIADAIKNVEIRFEQSNPTSTGSTLAKT